MNGIPQLPLCGAALRFRQSVRCNERRQAAQIPAGRFVGRITYDAATQMLQISVGGLAAAAVRGLAVAGGIFKMWGRK